MNETIVLFTANALGGIIQFTVQLFRVLEKKNYKVRVFMPEDVQKTDLSELGGSLVLYKKEKRVLDNGPYKNIASIINKMKPSLVWFTDNSAVSQKVGLYIDKQTKQLLTMHDAGNYHPTSKMGLYTFASNKYAELVSKRYFKKVFRFVLLSKESVTTFQKNFPRYQESTVLMNLGTHLPFDAEIEPIEANGLSNKNYYLFFGRIDKYKGIENLLRAYNASSCAYPLLVAGGGRLSTKEYELSQKNKNVVLINRYILDGEMKWLLSHAMMVCLPYIEATQSGVIPLAYYYQKPVVVSNVAGLTQFVQDGKTGIICSKEEEWVRVFNEMKENDAISMKNDILKFYEENLNWDKNIEAVIRCINEANVTK